MIRSNDQGPRTVKLASRKEPQVRIIESIKQGERESVDHVGAGFHKNSADSLKSKKRVLERWVGGEEGFVVSAAKVPRERIRFKSLCSRGGTFHTDPAAVVKLRRGTR